MRLRITIEGVAYEVDVEVLDDGTGAAPAPPASSSAANPSPAPAARPPSAAPSAPPAAPASPGGADVCKSPIAGTVLDVKVQAGDTVALNQVLMVVEAMKMETNIAAPVAGTVGQVRVAVGETVKPGQVLVEFEG